MKRPYPLNFAILLLCALCLAVAALTISLEDHRAQLREIAGNQIALSDEITDAKNDLMSELSALANREAPLSATEACQPISEAWIEYENRRVEYPTGVCDERHARHLQRIACLSADRQPRQFTLVISDWERVLTAVCY